MGFEGWVFGVAATVVFEDVGAFGAWFAASATVVIKPRAANPSRNEKGLAFGFIPSIYTTKAGLGGFHR
jgi:hypothetical protein